MQKKTTSAIKAEAVFFYLGGNPGGNSLHRGSSAEKRKSPVVVETTGLFTGPSEKIRTSGLLNPILTGRQSAEGLRRGRFPGDRPGVRAGGFAQPCANGHRSAKTGGLGYGARSSRGNQGVQLRPPVLNTYVFTPPPASAGRRWRRRPRSDPPASGP